MPQHDSTRSTILDSGRMAYLMGERLNALGTHTARIGWLMEQDELTAWANDVQAAQRIHGGQNRQRRA